MEVTHSETTSGSDVERFGTLLRRFRLRAGLSQEQLSELARISVEATGALERGTRLAPQRKTLELLIGALALAPEEQELLTRAAVRPSRPRERKASETVSFFQAPPVALTSFVGRTQDLESVLALLERSRLVTVVGSGGVGKTRLVSELVPHAAPGYRDGISMVPLSAVLPNAPILPAIASALGLHDEGAVPLDDGVRASIGAHRMLLILDNCEHVLDRVAPLVNDLLACCSNLRILATSRERLRVDGERVHRLKPLELGDAVSVFIDRASAVGFDPTTSDDDLATATEICERVDRIPLTIELAAASSDVFGFKAILDQLPRQTLISTSGLRTGLPRHQSLDSLVEWSYDRLGSVEASVFRGLAPFVGGCRLDDAQAILSGASMSADDVSRSLLRLHDQSLVESNREKLPRFSTLHTMRDFANKRLGNGDERVGLMRRFGAHYLELAAALESDLRSFNQASAIDRMSAEVPNVRVALQTFAADPYLEECGLAGLAALSQFWIRSGAIAEASAIYDTIDFHRFRSTPDLVRALIGGALIELNRQNPRTASVYARRARDLAATLDVPWLEIHAGIAQHTCAEFGHDQELPESFEAIYERAENVGEPWLICAAALRMGSIQARTDPVVAIGHLRRALQISLDIGDELMTVTTQLTLAGTLLHSNPTEAATHVIGAWNATAPSHTLGRARCIERLAWIALTLQRPDEGAFLLGVALKQLAEVAPKSALNSELRPAAAMLLATHASTVEHGRSTPPEAANQRVEAFIASIPGTSS